MSQSVDEIAWEIVRREGGFVNDPDDPGGATKHGVTIHTMRRLGLDLDKDGDIDVQDVHRIDRDLAVKIFKRHYFYGPKIDRLPEALHPTVFDMYVNAGSNAVKLLQRMMNKFDENVIDDGVIGPITIAACQRIVDKAPFFFVNAYGISRRNYYYRLADRRPAMRKYARRRDGGKGGWITRAEEFLDRRYHYSETQHQQRTAHW